MAGGIPCLGCPCDYQRERQPARGTVSDNSLGSPSDGTGMVSSVFHAESWAMLQLVARLWMSRFRLCYQDGGLNQLREVLL